MLQLQVLGNIGKDATCNETNGKKVLNFSVCHTEKWKDGNDVVHTRSSWVSCSLWDRPKLAPYLTKGTKVYVSGTPSINQYTGTDGKTYSDMRLTVFAIELCSAKKDDVAAPAAQQTDSTNQPSATEPDDLPF